MRLGQQRSWVLACIALLIGSAELILDNGLFDIGTTTPVLHQIVELIEILIMVPGLAIGVFCASEWVAARQRAMHRSLSDAREERFALLGRLAASVAHEVRNPLQSLRLVHEAMEGNSRPEDADLLRRLDSNLTDIDAAITRIYELVRPVLGDDALRETVDCRELLEHVVGDFPLAEQASIRWHPSRSQRVLVQSVPSGLRIALGNVVRNALEAAAEQPTKGEITITFERKPGRICIRITNPGRLPSAVGHGPAVHDSNKQSGLGLGLMISEQVLGRLGGTLDLQQRGELVESVVCLPCDSGLDP